MIKPTAGQRKRILDAVANSGELVHRVGDRMFWTAVGRMRAAGLVEAESLRITDNARAAVDPHYMANLQRQADTTGIAALTTVHTRAGDVAAALIAGDDAAIDAIVEQVDAEVAGMPTNAARDLCAAYRVARRDDRGVLGKIVAVYGDDATATRVKVAWGEHAGTVAHYAIADAVDESVADLVVAIADLDAPGQVEPVVDVDVDDAVGWGQPDGMLGPTEAEREIEAIAEAAARFEAACESGVDIDARAAELHAAVRPYFAGMVAEAIVVGIETGRITPATGHTTRIEAPGAPMGAWSASCEGCAAGGAGYEEPIEAVASALAHGPLAADTRYVLAGAEPDAETLADLETLTELATFAVSEPRAALVAQTLADTLDAIGGGKPIG